MKKNLLTNIFLEFFWNDFYQNSQWRKYIEYIMNNKDWYSGEICFFHFSSIQNENRKNNIKIISFLRNFYSLGYKKLFPLLKYALEKWIVITTNSLTEYTFIIKFRNEYEILNLLTDFIKKNTTLVLDETFLKNWSFFEFEIDVSQGCRIKKVKSYKQDTKADVEKNLVKKWIEKDNIFQVGTIYEIDVDNNKIDTATLIKLKNPIQIQTNTYFHKTYSKYIKDKFDKDIYIAFIEYRDFDESFESVYFTHWFFIDA
jgi:hypothetical protein